MISLINVLEVDANYMYSDYLGNSQISKIYEHSLSREEVDAIKKYRELSEEGKRLVRLIINEEYSRTTAGNQLTLPCYLPGVRKIHTGFLMQAKVSSVRIALKDLPKGTDFCFQIQVDQWRFKEGRRSIMRWDCSASTGSTISAHCSTSRESAASGRSMSLTRIFW